jgi:hypothetical protein
MSKPTLLLDFDGVLHDYHGEYTPDGLAEPLPQARHACLLLERHFRLVVFTSRPKMFVEPWLKRYGFPPMPVTNVKTTAFAIVDDRAVCFPGKWTDEFLLQLRDFQPWWKLTDVAVASPEAPTPSSPSPAQAE